MRFLRFAPLFPLLLTLFPSQTWAWGNEGHRIIADIAWDHLDRKTLLRLRPFLGNYDLAAISTWADDVRGQHSETGPWHYVDIPSTSAGYQPKDCLNDNCVVARIRLFASVLGDPQQSFAARSEALRFLVHFVGDLSQPMHAMGDARGGNDVPVTFFGAAKCGEYPCNLHNVWDSELIRHTGVEEYRYTYVLETMIATDHLHAGKTDPVGWANSSFQLAKTAWVAPHAEVGQGYYDRQRPVVDRELALGGLRLAQVLNEELGRR